LLVKVAWISYFPIERLPDLPEPLRGLRRQHPATWQRVLLEEFAQNDDGNEPLELHVIVVRSSFPADCSFEWKGVKFHCLKLPRGTRDLTLYWWETWRIRHCLRSIQPDLVHAWGSEQGAALVASRLPFPYLVTMQGLLEWYLQQAPLNWHLRIDACLERPALRRASIVTTESSFGVQWLRQHYPHLEVLQAEHAPNWIFHRLQRQPEVKPLRFLFIGFLSQIKGTDLLVKALDRLCLELDFHVTLVGVAAPGYLEELRAATSPALWERIRQRDDITPSDIAEEISRATIMLFPTRADTSPNSVKEAVVAGLPVVASTVGGIVDYVLPGRNGFTFPAGDLDAFVNAIRAAAKHPLFSRGQVEPGALSEMRNYLSPRVMSGRFMAAYKRVLEKGPAKDTATSMRNISPLL
jgi:glycosyltransferase involved in cell wall biosynthesis